jgi:hypothetical protein
MLKFLNIVYSHRWDLKDLAERFLVFLFLGGGGREHVNFFEAEFLDQIETKVLRVLLLAIQSQLYSFAWRFLLLQTHTTSYSF